MPVTRELWEAFVKAGVNAERILRDYVKIRVEGAEWISVGGSLEGVYVGVDSSRQAAFYRPYYVYAVQGAAVAYDSTRRNYQTTYMADVDVIEPLGVEEFMPARRVRAYILEGSSKNIEVSLASRALSDSGGGGLILFDGSYISFLLPVRVQRDVPGELENLKRVVDKLWGEWAQRVNNIIENSKTTLFISKTVTKTYLTPRGNQRIKVTLDNREISVPDFIVADKVASEKGRKPGFLWYEKQDNAYFNVGNRILETAKRERVKVEEWYTLTYILLHPLGGIYQLTIPGKRTQKEVERIVSALTGISPAGYPQPLAIAHQASRLTRKDFKNLVTQIMPPAETGREPLERTIKGQPARKI